MFIFTARLNRKKMAVAAGAAAVLCLSAAVLLFGARQAQAAAAVSPKGVRSAEDRVAYLGQWGWQVDPQPLRTEELVLPERFGEEYDKYLALQEEAGFDLTDYAGKRVKRYTYQVRNHPTGQGEATAHLLVRGSRVIGGEILGRDFIHSLAMPQ